MANQADPLNGRYGWIIAVAGAFVIFIAEGIYSIFGVIFQEVRDHFGITRTQAAFAGSITAFSSYTFAGLLMIILGEHFSGRTICVVFSVLSSICAVCSAFSTSFAQFFIFYSILTGSVFTLIGTSLGCIIVPPIVECGRYFSTRRTSAMAITFSGSGVAIFGMQSIIGPQQSGPECSSIFRYIVSNYNWQNAFVLMAAILLQNTVFAALLRPLEDNYPSKAPNEIKTSRPMNSQKAAQIRRKFHEDHPITKQTTAFHSCKSPPVRYVSVDNLGPSAGTNLGRLVALSYSGYLNFPEPVQLSNERKTTIENDNVANDKPPCSCTVTNILSAFWDRSLWHNLQFHLLSYIQFACLSAYYTMLVFGDDILSHATKVAQSKSEQMFTYAGVAALLGFYLPPALHLVAGFNSVLVQLATFTIASLAALLMPLQFGFILVTTSVSVVAFCVSSLRITSAQLLAEKFTIEKLNVSYNSINIFRGFGTFVGPMLCGVWIDQTNWRGAAGTLVALFLLSSTVCSAVIFLQDKRLTQRSNTEIAI